MERVKAHPETAAGRLVARGRTPAAESVRSRVPLPGAPADSPVVAVKPARIAAGVERRGGVVLARVCAQPQGRKHMPEPRLKGKSYVIPKRLLWDAWLKVKENGGSAGADGVSIEQFEEGSKDHLYVLWNRMSSGSYFPGPVRAVDIPKKDGTRRLGIPTVTSYPEVVQAVFGFAGGDASVSSVGGRAPTGVVRASLGGFAFVCVRGAVRECVVARGCYGSWARAGLGPVDCGGACRAFCVAGAIGGSLAAGQDSEIVRE